MKNLWILVYLCAGILANENEIDDVQFSTEPVEMTVEEGEEAVLPCSAHSNSKYTITWESGKAGVLTTGDERVTSDNRFSLHKMESGSWNLRISDVMPDDEGVYNCVINTNPPLTKDITLKIGYAVDIKPSRGRVIKQKNKRAKLECMVSGKPAPATRWMIEGKEVKADNRHLIDLVDKGEFNSVMRLKIKRLKEKDFGQYTCTAVNEFGEASAAIDLIEPRRMNPTFNAKSDNISGQPGSTVALPCAVDSLGKHQVLWVRENVELLTQGNQRKSQDDRLHVERSTENSWDLVISDVTEDDAGEYMCQINTNPPIMKTVSLRVGNAPVAEITQRSISKSIGDDVSLSCTIRGHPQDFVTWTLNTSDIPIGEKYDIRIEDVDNVTSILKLNVRQLVRQDFGVYTCRASNQFGVTEASLSLKEMESSSEPRFEDTPNNITVKEGETAVLPCSITGKGETRVMWVYGKLYLTVGRRLMNSDKRFSIQKTKNKNNDWNLQIKKVKYRDAGIYRCRMESGGVRTVFLNVEAESGSSGPMFESGAVNISAVAGSTAVLPCGVKELGRYQVVWSGPSDQLLTFKSKIVGKDKRLRVVRPYHKDWNLQITGVGEEDEGMYMCQINTSPVKQRNVFLTVQSPTKLNKEWSSQDSLVLKGQEAELVCNVTGDPDPKVTWRRTESGPFCKGTHMVGDLGQILSITDVGLDCDGAYECIAYNGMPPAVRYTVQLTVGVEPEVLLSSERLMQKAGKDAILDCVATMNPPDEFAWYKDGLKLEEGFKTELYEEEDGQLTLSLHLENIGPVDFGEYTCAASNAFGVDEKTLTLYELVEPTSPPVINDTLPDEVMVQEGKVAVLPCFVHNLGDEVVMWIKDDTEVLTEGEDSISMDTRISVDSSVIDSWELVIREVTSSDAGVYTCQTEAGEDVISRNVTLTVTVPSYFMAAESDDVTVSEGDNVTLTCEASGLPVPTVTWSVNEGNKCTHLDNHTGGQLIIQEITRECSGTFTCTARNGYGDPAVKTVNLAVYYPPKVTLQGPMILQEVGQDARLECSVVTLPLGTVTWYKGDERIHHDDKFKVEMRNEEGLFTLILVIRVLQIEDFGDYTCKASNNLGSDAATVYLNSPAVLKYDTQMETMTVQKDQSATLTCEAMGVPKPNITWYRMVSANAGMDSPEEVVVYEGPEYMLTAVQKSDAGTYKCMANNGYPTANNNDFKLVTLAVEYPPSIVLETDDDDDEKVLRCRVTAFPQGIAMWTMNGIEVTEGDQHKIEVNYIGNSTLELVLYISSLGNKAFYYYTCVASNQLGEAREEVKLEGEQEEKDLFGTGVTEYDLVVDETTMEPEMTGVRRKKPKKDREHHHPMDSDSKKPRGKKHKKGKKHHRKDKHHRKEEEEEDHSVHRIDTVDNEIDHDMDETNDNALDTDENRVEIPYRTSGGEESRSGQTRDKDAPKGASTHLSFTATSFFLSIFVLCYLSR